MTHKSIEEISSVHLGKSADGNVSAPYVTPRSVDKNLLVAIPRHLNRKSLPEKDFKGNVIEYKGYDVWHAYEFSTLVGNRVFNAIIKIVFCASTENIVESKSLKLYFNSFNMANFNEVDDVRNLILADLNEKIGPVESVSIFDVSKPIKKTEPFENSNFFELTTVNMKVKTPLTDNDLSCVGTQQYKTHILRSNCRVTNQPDFGDVFIHHSGAHVSSHALYQYIFSLREENHFHEEICEQLFSTLMSEVYTHELIVSCFYTRRGGIDINPIRYHGSIFLLDGYNIVRPGLTYGMPRQ